ncbi:MAG: hypothetical protein RIQ52_895 [Pseudomonadota bacterium]
MDVLAFFVINFALPALLFLAIVRHPLLTLQHIRLLQAYTLASLTVFVAVAMVAALITRRGLLQGTKLAMGTAFSNSAFMGYPIAQRVIGEQAGDMLVIYVAVENLLLLPLALTMLALGEHSGRQGISIFWGVLSGVLRKPLILAILGGIACSLFRLEVPVVAGRCLDMLSGAAAPVALFYIGGILSGLQMGHLARDILGITLAKLLLHPLAVLLACILMAIDSTDLARAAVLNAAMPMFSIYPILCQKYDPQGACAASLVVATAVSFFTLTTALWLLDNGF